MAFRQEYNCCKTYGCPNCGNPDLALYSRSNRLGYEAWHCDQCGAYPPVLLNQPILALAQQIQTHRHHNSVFPQCRCANPKIHRFGFTRQGSQRIKCSCCGVVNALPNVQTLVRKLQPILDVLISGVPPSQLQKACKLPNKTFAQNMSLMCELLNHASRMCEKHLSIVGVQTQTSVHSCRSGFLHQNHKQSAAHLWTVSSADAHSGYILLINDNALFDTGSLNSHMLEKSRYQLDEHEEQQINQDVLVNAESTYNKILARSQFDQIAYSTQAHAQCKDAVILRPVYAAHAHFQNLKALLAPSLPHYILLEHESFLRGAAITAFDRAVRRGGLDLYYHHLSRISADARCDTSTRVMSWWNEKWHRIQVSNESGQWQIGVCGLTANKRNLTSLFPSHPDWNGEFWRGFNDWMGEKYPQRISIQRFKQWQAIYRFLFNVVFDDRANISQDGLNPSSIEQLVLAMINQRYFQR
ncbi:MAG: hypothetical protein HWE19_16890 [Vibrionaceae bacterium]|nr:hypothetical protein [Vibrionaceae bacterium]